MKLKIIVPIITKLFEEETEKEVQQFLSPGTEIDVECIPYGSASIESAYDEVACAPGIVHLAEKAQKQGFDGVFIDCMGDPALTAARERLEIPVVGPGRTSMLFAADLSHRFSVVTVLESVVVLLENLANEAGIGKKLASIRWVNIPVLELNDRDKLMKALIEESERALLDDRAHALILGCTGMMGVADELSKELFKRNYRVPLIYPVSTALKYLETLVNLKLTHSKKTYQFPSNKERNLWKQLGL